MKEKNEVRDLEKGLKNIYSRQKKEGKKRKKDTTKVLD